jgi:hypothetical protein
MSDRTVLLGGVRVPRFLYGTAWKEERTQPLTELAVRQGFRGIDAANQRRHYHETPRVVPDDPEDDKLVAAALVAGAALVTNDGHLLALAGHGGLEVVRPADRWAR